ncbi:KH homology domain-containing protein 4-like [Huso huso]|uniref:KH homology domain-containing protein 4 n=1 Tax=Huso huso TaxID=61971 RepID=A0ABR0YWH7_HUSHU
MIFTNNQRCHVQWDQPSTTASMLQGFAGSFSHPVSLPVSSLQSIRTHAYLPNNLGNLGTAVSLASNMDRASSTAPVPNTSVGGHSSSQSSAVEAAAAMAAKINAMLLAKGKLKTPQTLPEKNLQVGTVFNTDNLVTELDINDVPVNCRNFLTKGQTQDKIHQYSGATVSTKGYYMTSAEKAHAKGTDRPLYLHVQGKTQEEVNKAVACIKEIISEDVLRTALAQPQAVAPAVPIYNQPSKPAAHVHSHTGHFVHAKLFVGLHQTLPSFNVNERIEGPGGSYLHHIQTETGARVFLRGKGSGYMEQASKRESFEPLYLYISHPTAVGLEAAKKLCESLLETVRSEHSRLLSMYTAGGSSQAYPSSLGYPPSNSYCSQTSWYNYSSTGYMGDSSAYPASSGYWSSSNGPHSHSNISSTPQSSQAMVQYPVCPRKQPSYLTQDTPASYCPSSDVSSSSPPRPSSPKRHFSDKTNETTSGYQHGPIHPNNFTSDTTVKSEKMSSTSKNGDGKELERLLMPPPPPPTTGTTRKRQRTQGNSKATLGSRDPAAFMKKQKTGEDDSGLVPYSGDSSDEEEDRFLGSKMPFQ